jgi:outer membrane protein OmpA-like peptidoglycan-associated protein
MPRRRSLLSGLALLLGACAGTVPPGAAPAPRGAEPAGALLREAGWLRSWFEGTPVRVETPGSGQLRVVVPREFCFDPGRARVKPALAAVLAKLAESLRRLPQAELALVATPDEAPRGKALAGERAAQVRRALSERGVPLPQLGGDSTSGGELLRLEITLPQA